MIKWKLSDLKLTWYASTYPYKFVAHRFKTVNFMAFVAFCDRTPQFLNYSRVISILHVLALILLDRVFYFYKWVFSTWSRIIFIFARSGYFSSHRRYSKIIKIQKSRCRLVSNSCRFTEYLTNKGIIMYYSSRIVWKFPFTLRVPPYFTELPCNNSVQLS